MFLERGNDNITYDPQVDGYSSGVFWTTVTGTPAISSTFLRFNAASAYTLSRHTLFMDMEFSLTVPTAPTLGDARKWGMFMPALGNRGACYFEISGTTFRVRAYDNNGTTLLVDQTVAWDAAWTATATRYRIAKTERGAQFFINDTLVSGQSMPSTDPLKVVNIPLAVGISNSNADNMDLSYLMLRGISNLT